MQAYINRIHAMRTLQNTVAVAKYGGARVHHSMILTNIYNQSDHNKFN